MPADATKQHPACIVSMHVLGVTPIAGTCKGNASASPALRKISIYRSSGVGWTSTCPPAAASAASGGCSTSTPPPGRRERRRQSAIIMRDRRRADPSLTEALDRIHPDARHILYSVLLTRIPNPTGSWPRRVTNNSPAAMCRSGCSKKSPDSCRTNRCLPSPLVAWNTDPSHLLTGTRWHRKEVRLLGELPVIVERVRQKTRHRSPQTPTAPAPSAAAPETELAHAACRALQGRTV